MIYCNNTSCRHYDNQQCKAAKVYYIDRRCATYRKRREPNYGEMMRPDVGICERERGRMKRKR
ncbi:MAG: hypothetical protein ACRDBM_09360 [Sporomusa sp.]